MEVENPMVLPEVEYPTQEYWDKYNEALAEKSDIDYEDRIFDEMNEEEI